LLRITTTLHDSVRCGGVRSMDSGAGLMGF